MVAPGIQFVLWLLDTGTASHFTFYYNNLINPEELVLSVYIQVLDGSRLKATHKDFIILNFTFNQEIDTSLNLLRFFHVLDILTGLFYFESFSLMETLRPHIGEVKLFYVLVLIFLLLFNYHMLLQKLMNADLLLRFSLMLRMVLKLH